MSTETPPPSYLPPKNPLGTPTPQQPGGPVAPDENNPPNDSDGTDRPARTP